MSLGMKRTRPLRVVSTTIEGKREDILPHFDRMYAWARKRGLRTGERETSGRVNLPWMALFEDDEATTPETVRRIQLWMPIDGGGAGGNGYEVEDIPHETVAFKIHRGPLVQLDEAIAELFEWATRKELSFRDRWHRIVYLRGIDPHPEDPDWEAEIQIPLVSARGS